MPNKLAFNALSGKHAMHEAGTLPDSDFLPLMHEAVTLPESGGWFRLNGKLPRNPATSSLQERNELHYRYALARGKR